MSKRTYPYWCWQCVKETVERATVPHVVEVTLDGVLSIRVPIPELPVDKCSNCGAMTMDLASDRVTNEAVAAAFKAHPLFAAVGQLADRYDRIVSGSTQGAGGVWFWNAESGKNDRLGSITVDAELATRLRDLYRGLQPKAE